MLHPSKFGPDGDFPHKVALPDLPESVGPDWTLSYEDTIGELHIGLLLNEFLGGPNIAKLVRVAAGGGQDLAFRGSVKSAAEGWDGDRARAFTGPDGRIGIVWVSMWDSPEDAEQFAAAYRTGERYKLETYRYAGALSVETDGAVVYIVEGFDAEATPAILEALKGGTGITPDRRDKADVAATADDEAGTTGE